MSSQISSRALRVRHAVLSVLGRRVYGVLRLWRERALRLAFRRRVVRHRYGNRELSVVVADPTSALWYDRDWATPSEIELLGREGQLQAGATVFDLGAHQAVVAMILADRVGPAGRVIALEALERNVEIGTTNVASNTFANITLIHAAAADAPGVVSFVPSGNGHVADDETAVVTVRAMSVDELSDLHGPPQVLFVDVEGYELHVLRGARRTLATARPDLFIEVHTGVGLDHWGTPYELLAEIPDDYALFVAPGDNTPFVPIAEGRQYLTRHSLLVALASGGRRRISR